MIILIYLYKFIIFVWIPCLHAFLCITCVPGVHRDQKMLSDTLGLELQTIESLCVGDEIQMQVFQKSNHWTISEPHMVNFWYIYPHISLSFLWRCQVFFFFLKKYPLFLENLSRLQWKNSLLCTVDINGISFLDSILTRCSSILKIFLDCVPVIPLVGIYH